MSNLHEEFLLGYLAKRYNLSPLKEARYFSVPGMLPQADGGAPALGEDAALPGTTEPFFPFSGGR